MDHLKSPQCGMPSVMSEFFAQAYTTYVLHPFKLEEEDRELHDWLRDNIFEGRKPRISNITIEGTY